MSRSFLPFVAALATVTAFSAGTALAQVIPPHARLSMMTYGHRTSSSNHPGDPSLNLDVDPVHAGGPQLVLSGGTSGEPGVVLFDYSRAWIRIPGGGVLHVGISGLFVAGVFGNRGEILIPWKLSSPAFAGAQVRAQGMHLFTVQNQLAYALSAGLDLRLGLPYSQPALSYTGPPIEGILVRRIDHRGRIYANDIALSAKTSGPNWAWSFDRLEELPGRSRLFLELRETAPNQGAGLLSTHRTLVQLGVQPESSIEVNVRLRDVDGNVGPEQLALVLARDF